MFPHCPLEVAFMGSAGPKNEFIDDLYETVNNREHGNMKILINYVMEEQKWRIFNEVMSNNIRNKCTSADNISVRDSELYFIFYENH